MISLASLSGRRGYALGVALAFLIALPTLGFGFFMDDYLHLKTIEGHNDLASPFDLFVFGAGDEEQMRPYLETGPYPWFMDPEFKAHFFRPLSSALMVLDHRLFGHFAPLYHAHSILWYVLLCLGVMLILRRSLPPAVGVLALFLFVVDESHAFPVAWWSNRNAVVAVAFGFLGIAAHLRWREENWRPGLVLSLIAYSGALLASENGLGALAYVLAYELFGSQNSPRTRFYAILPASLLAMGYYAFYQWGGYGTQFSDIYLNPGTNPVEYLAAAPARFLMLMGAHFFMLPCEAALLQPALEPFFVALGVCALTGVAFTVYVLWAGFDEKERRALRWLVPGALLATTPGLAAIVSSRVLLAPSLGGAIIVAMIVVHIWRLLARSSVPSIKHRLLQLLMWSALILHLGIAALSWPAQVFVLRSVMNHLNHTIRTAEIDEDRVETSQLVIINAPDPYTGLYPLMLRYYDRLPQPRSWWTLSIAPYDHRLTRLTEHEMELEIVGGALFTSPMEKLFRSNRNPLKTGERLDLKGLIITVLETRDSGPFRMRLEFEEAPESLRYQLLVFHEGAYQRILPPEPGETINLPFAFP